MSEKRKFERWPLNSFLNAYDVKNDTAIGYLADISYGGVMLVSEQPILTGEEISLKVEMPEDISEEADFEFSAKSIRCSKDSDFSYYDTGFRFDNLPEERIKLIEHLIEVYGF